MRPAATQLKQKLKDVVSEAMLEAAEACMIRRGYAEVTIQQIAAEAGCAAGTIYLHFKNKDELLKAVVDKHARVIFAGAREALVAETDPVRKVYAGVRAFLAYADKHRPFMRLFFEAIPVRYRSAQQKVGGETREQSESYDALEAESLRQAQERGLIRADLPPERLQMFISDVGMSICEEFVQKDDTSLEKYVKLFWGLIAGGLGVREEKLS